MITTHRSYSEAQGDFGHLARFFIAHNRAIRTYSTWCLGRVVDWRFAVYPHKRPIAQWCEANGHLWFDGFGELVGFAVAESGDAEFALITTAGHRFLFPQMLDWAVQAWADRESAAPTAPDAQRFSIEVTERQTYEIRALERAGFCYRRTFYSERFDLTQPLPSAAPLEPGFTVVDMASHPDYRSQRIMRNEAFQGRANLSEEELARDMEWHLGYQANPIYHAPTDLVVMADDGTIVAGCEALIDAHDCEADVERVCTHSAYRRRGFARAAIQECLHRLQDMGMERAAIAGYSQEAVALYSSLGAQSEMQFYTYERP